MSEKISRAAAKLGAAPVPPATLPGVAALDVPDHLVEIEATAVLDRTDALQPSAEVADRRAFLRPRRRGA